MARIAKQSQQDAGPESTASAQASAQEPSVETQNTKRERKRGQNEGSIFKREDGRWCAVANLGYEGGKRKRKYLYGDTRAEVAKLLTKELQNKDHGLPTVPERLTVKDYLDGPVPQRAILRRALNQGLKWRLVHRNFATLVDLPRWSVRKSSHCHPSSHAHCWPLSKEIAWRR